MAAGIPPPPLNSPNGSYYWLEWYTQLTNILNGTGYPWTSLNFTNSNIHDIVQRRHNSLDNIQGGNAAGDAAGTGNAFHALGFGFVDPAATSPKLPPGWTVARTSAGVYTITMTVGLTAPNFMAGATSNTPGNVVQYVDVSGTNSFVVNCTNSSGSASVDTAFSFWVTKI